MSFDLSAKIIFDREISADREALQAQIEENTFGSARSKIVCHSKE
jgi:hypothetical protein